METGECRVYVAYEMDMIIDSAISNLCICLTMTPQVRTHSYWFSAAESISLLLQEDMKQKTLQIVQSCKHLSISGKHKKTSLQWWYYYSEDYGKKTAPHLHSVEIFSFQSQACMNVTLACREQIPLIPAEVQELEHCTFFFHIFAQLSPFPSFHLCPKLIFTLFWEHCLGPGFSWRPWSSETRTKSWSNDGITDTSEARQGLFWPANARTQTHTSTRTQRNKRKHDIKALNYVSN